MSSSKYDSAVGCLLGGAFGDSLGAGCEFFSLNTIRATHGIEGVTRLAPAFGLPAGVITDDTQMAIATAEGLLAVTPSESNNDTRIVYSIWQEYLRWYRSQNDPRQQRAPGGTCMSALGSGKIGTPRKPLNDSAGCGGIMRAHPVGIAFAHDSERAFQVGMQSAAITHGSAEGYVPAGALAMLVAILSRARGEMAFDDALNIVMQRISVLEDKGIETLMALMSALSCLPYGDLGANIDKYVGQANGMSFGARGGGWLGHDALAIAVYAVRCAPNDPVRAVRIAVNHSGDSDSTGSIAGAIMGAMYGPAAFMDELEAQKVMLERTEELCDLALRLADWSMKAEQRPEHQAELQERL